MLEHKTYAHDEYTEVLSIFSSDGIESCADLGLAVVNDDFNFWDVDRILVQHLLLHTFSLLFGIFVFHVSFEVCLDEHEA